VCLGSVDSWTNLIFLRGASQGLLKVWYCLGIKALWDMSLLGLTRMNTSQGGGDLLEREQSSFGLSKTFYRRILFFGFLFVLSWNFCECHQGSLYCDCAWLFSFN
jgi:hypothetical protein